MTTETGVRCLQPDTGDRLVHRWEGGDYGLEDIPDLFQLGRIATQPGGAESIVLSVRDVHELKTLADAYSFDFESGLIQLCLDIHRFANERAETEFVLVQDF